MKSDKAYEWTDSLTSQLLRWQNFDTTQMLNVSTLLSTRMTLFDMTFKVWAEMVMIGSELTLPKHHDCKL